MDDKLIVEQLKKGDKRAFDNLIMKYQGKIFNTAFHMLNDYYEAFDAIQETYVKIYKNIANFKEDSSFSTWVYCITKNVCIDILRKRKEPVLSLDDDEKNSFSVSNFEHLPEENAERRQQIYLINDALLKLDDNLKTVFIMYAIKGFSYEEIAKKLDIPIGTVKSRLSRSRKKIRNILLSNRSFFL